MNILFSNSIKSSVLGGGEKWMIKAAKGLSQRGHTVYISAKKNSEILRAAEKAGIPTEIFNIRGDFSPIATLQIAYFLKKNNIDIVICNMNKDVRVAGLAARLAKHPKVLARHGVLLCKNKWLYKITLTKFADGILTNTKTIKNTYESYGWFPSNFITVLYNGLETVPRVEPYDFSHDFPGKKIIFSAGRLTPQKGYKYLIEAASILNKKRHDIAFVIAGSGSLEEKLKSRVKNFGLDNIFQFIGYQKNIFPFLRGCDIFALPSKHEGMPNVVMEAMGVGKPVIATNVNGVAELVENENSGLIVPPQNPIKISDAIEYLLNHPQIANQLGQNALKRVNKYFTYKKMIDNLESFLIEFRR